MNFLELIDAYVLAERRCCLTENQRGPGNGPYGPNHPDSIKAAGEAVALRSEIERRITMLCNLAAIYKIPDSSVERVLGGER